MRKQEGDHCGWRIGGSRSRLSVDSRARGRGLAQGEELPCRDCSRKEEREDGWREKRAIRVFRRSNVGLGKKKKREADLKKM